MSRFTPINLVLLAPVCRRFVIVIFVKALNYRPNKTDRNVIERLCVYNNVSGKSQLVPKRSQENIDFQPLQSLQTWSNGISMPPQNKSNSSISLFIFMYIFISYIILLVYCYSLLCNCSYWIKLQIILSWQSFVFIILYNIIVACEDSNVKIENFLVS